MSINPSTPEFPEGTVTVKLHRRKPLHLVVDRRELEESLVNEMEMQRTENKHLKRKLTRQAAIVNAAYSARLFFHALPGSSDFDDNRDWWIRMQEALKILDEIDELRT